MAYAVVEYRLRDRSVPYELHEEHTVAIRFLSQDLDRALEYYHAHSAGMEQYGRCGHAYMSCQAPFSSDEYGKHSMALLDLPEDVSMSVLAVPVIHVDYVE